MKKDPQRYYFQEATAYDNLDNLPGNFIETERESCADELTFDSEIMNRRVEKIENAYYSALSYNRHTYSECMSTSIDDK